MNLNTLNSNLLRVPVLFHHGRQFPTADLHPNLHPNLTKFHQISRPYSCRWATRRATRRGLCERFAFG